jgi:trans-aconitate 2-methyltransferase
LERHGLLVTYAALFDRLTKLEGGEEGVESWLRMFRRPIQAAVDPAQWAEFVRRTKELAAPHLFRDGEWYADYRRIRVVASRAISGNSWGTPGA